MSYIVLKSTPSDDGWVHEPVMWTVDKQEADGYANIHDWTTRHPLADVRIPYHVIETDMEPLVDACIGDGSYACGIGGVFYIDESRLDL